MKYVIFTTRTHTWLYCLYPVYGLFLIYMESVTLEGRKQAWMYEEKSKMDGLCFPRTSSGVDSFICHNLSGPDSVFISLFLYLCCHLFL